MNDSENDDLAAAVVAEERKMRAEALGEDADKPARAPRKPRKRVARAESNLAFEQRVQMAAGAFTATGSGLVANADLKPPFTSDHGMALAEAWVPVLDYYTAESENPLPMALLTTGVMVLPYLYQIMDRNKKAESTPTLPDDGTAS